MEAICQKIDEQVSRNKELLKRVIEKQISQDFRSAEQQIGNYINRFQIVLDRSLMQRENKEAQTENICANLEIQKTQLSKLMCELHSIQKSLDSWIPVQTS